jgi:hypothetical protein
MAQETVAVASAGAEGCSVWQAPLGANVLGTALNIKTTKGVIYGLRAASNTNTDVFLQFFNAPAASVTLGTTDPNFIVKVQAPAISASAMYGSVNLTFTPPIALGGTGLCVAATTAATNSTASTAFVNVLYK